MPRFRSGPLADGRKDAIRIRATILMACVPPGDEFLRAACHTDNHTHVNRRSARLPHGQPRLRRYAGSQLRYPHSVHLNGGSRGISGGC